MAFSTSSQDTNLVPNPTVSTLKNTPCLFLKDSSLLALIISDKSEKITNYVLQTQLPFT